MLFVIEFPDQDPKVFWTIVIRFIVELVEHIGFIEELNDEVLKYDTW